MDTPPGLRGNAYPTHLSARCPAFDACELCHACTKYNPHDLVCAICESRKPHDTICNHTDRQQYIQRLLTKLFKKPMFHPDTKGSDVGIPVAYNEEWQQIADGLDPYGLGKVAGVEELSNGQNSTG
jgi:hypothetical protein